MTQPNDPPRETAGDPRDLDRRIAERLGWHDFRSHDGWFDDPWVGPYEETYIEATDAEGHEHRLPYYATDLNTAMTLTEPYAFKLTSVYGWKGRIGYMATIDDKFGQGGIGQATTPALAICYAWLRYMELYATAAGEP
jgi:hypothetical protein